MPNFETQHLRRLGADQFATAFGEVFVHLWGRGAKPAPSDISPAALIDLDQRLLSSFYDPIGFMRQVHGDHVVEVHSESDYKQECDACISGSVNLAVRVADCVPIVIYSRGEKRIAAIHAGWRGLKAQITSKAVSAFRQQLADQNDLSVWVGPFIGANEYEVGPDVYEQFAEHCSHDKPEPQKRWLDLKAILADELQSIIPLDRVTWPTTTTLHNDALFSHRGGDKGRNIVVTGFVSG